MSDLLNNSVVFSQVSMCPLINGAVDLKTNTWELHIKARHPEMANSLQNIQNTVLQPDYVAKSRPGPDEKHAENIVLVNTNVRIRASSLHVFVESPRTKPTISTAMYLKSRHAEIIWENTSLEVSVSYDKDADVLYISKASPVAALTEEQDDGLLFRYSIEDDLPCGVTVMSFQNLWGQHRKELADRVSSFLNVPKDQTEKAVLSIT
jgi:uncharacterized protein YuzE